MKKMGDSKASKFIGWAGRITHVFRPKAQTSPDTFAQELGDRHKGPCFTRNLLELQKKIKQIKERHTAYFSVRERSLRGQL